MKNFQEFQEATRYKKEKGYDVGGTKGRGRPTPIIRGKTSNDPPSTSRDTVLDAVKKSITDKYGKGAIMRSGSNQQKKVKGQKSTAGTGKYKKMSDDRKQLKKDAKEMGYGSDTKGYIETRARYGSKENMKSGKGLGT